jgi:hypothetical protein
MNGKAVKIRHCRATVSDENLAALVTAKAGRLAQPETRVEAASQVRRPVPRV